MLKKILLFLVAVVVVVAGVAAMSAYEAHIINVTAHIENALSVDPEEIEFGTVFPQEYLERQFTISLSDSFLEADRVDDVEYTIKQKPKCTDGQGNYVPVNYATHECPDGFEPMLSLCPYLSKTKGPSCDSNDTGVASYFQGDHCATPVPDFATGKLTKKGGDTSDEWLVDLKVPPVEGYVGQDWPVGCPVLEEDDADYGCDLWIEITSISECDSGCQ